MTNLESAATIRAQLARLNARITSLEEQHLAAAQARIDAFVAEKMEGGASYTEAMRMAGRELRAAVETVFGTH